MTVAELLGRISSRELSEWQAYFILEAEEASQVAAEAQAGLSPVHRQLMTRLRSR